MLQSKPAKAAHGRLFSPASRQRTPATEARRQARLAEARPQAPPIPSGCAPPRPCNAVPPALGSAPHSRYRRLRHRRARRPSPPRACQLPAVCPHQSRPPPPGRSTVVEAARTSTPLARAPMSAGRLSRVLDIYARPLSTLAAVATLAFVVCAGTSSASHAQVQGNATARAGLLNPFPGHPAHREGHAERNQGQASHGRGPVGLNDHCHVPRAWLPVGAEELLSASAPDGCGSARLGSVSDPRIRAPAAPGGGRDRAFSHQTGRDRQVHALRGQEGEPADADRSLSRASGREASRLL